MEQFFQSVGKFLGAQAVLLTVVYVILFGTILTYCSLPSDTKSDIQSLATSFQKISQSQETLNDGNRQLLSDLLRIKGDVDLLVKQVFEFKVMLATQPKSLPANEKTPNQPSPPITDNSGNNPIVPMTIPHEPSPAEINKANIIELQLNMKSQFDAVFEKIDSTSASVNTKFSAILDRPQAAPVEDRINWTEFLAATLPSLIKFCIWACWIITGLTLIMPKRFSALARTLPSIKSRTALRKTAGAILLLAYSVLMIVGYTQTLEATFADWTSEMRHLLLPFIFAGMLVAVIYGTRMHWLLKSALSIAAIAGIVWVTLMANAESINPKLPPADYYYAALLQFLSKTAWNQYAASVVMLLLIIALYIVRMFQITIDLFRENETQSS